MIVDVASVISNTSTISGSISGLTRYWLGTDGVAPTDPTVAANWSATSGGTPGASVPGASDSVIFDGGGVHPCTLVGNTAWGSLTVLAAYASKLDLGDQVGGWTLTITDGGSITLDGGGTFDCGTAIISITNGTFDNENQETFTRGSSTLVLNGICTLKRNTTSVRALCNVTIAVGATATDVRGGFITVGGILTCNGTLSIADTKTTYVDPTSKVIVASTGTITGVGGTLRVNSSPTYGITSFATGGVINVGTLWIYQPVADSIFAAGTYTSALVKFSQTHASNSYTLKMNGTYIFTGNVEFENDDTGTLVIDNATYDPNIEIRGNVVWDNSGGGTLTYTKGDGTLTFSGSSDQTINFGASTTEKFVIDKAAGFIDFTGGTFVAGGACAAHTLKCSTGAANVDLDTYALTMADGGSILLDGAGTYDMGTGQTSITNGTFDNEHQTTFTCGTGTLVFNGVCTLNRGTALAKAPKNMTVMNDASVTDVLGGYIPNGGILTCNGVYAIPLNKTANVYSLGKVVLGASGQITGTGTMLCVSCQATYGLTSFAAGGIIDVALLHIQQPVAGTVLADGTYSCPLVKISQTHASNTYTLQLNGDYIFTGNVEFENDDTGTLVIDNATYDPNIEIRGNVVWDNSGGGTLTYTKGDGTLTFSGTSNQSINFNGQATEDIVINKTAGTLTFANNILTDSIDHQDGTLNPNAKLVTALSDWHMSSGTVLSNPSGSTFAIGNDAVWQGTSDSLLTLSGNNTWDFVCDGQAQFIHSNVAYCDATNSALAVDATSGSFNYGNNYNVSFGAMYYPFTLSCWAKRDTHASGEEYIVSLNDADDPNKYYGIIISTGDYIGLSARNTTPYLDYSTETLASGEDWKHVAAVFEGNQTRKLYVNGALVETAEPNFVFFDGSGVDTLLVGLSRILSASGYFHGTLADLRLYKNSLSDLQIGSIYSGLAITPQPFGQWITEGGPVTDASVDIGGSINSINSYNGNTDITLDTTPAGGEPTRSADGVAFDGSQSIKSNKINWAPVIEQSFNVDLEMSVNDTTPTAAMKVFDSDDDETSMVIATDGEVIINAGTSWSTGYIVPDTELHKYRIVFRGGSSILYVDGQLQARGNAGTNSLDGLVLGSNKYQDDDWFDGTIKKFKIYTR